MSSTAEDSAEAARGGLLERAIAFAHRHPWRWFAAYFVVTAVLYGLALFAPIYPPFVIEPTAIDRAIPLLPWTAWLYVTYFLLMPSYVALARRHPERGRWLTAAGLVVLGNLTINILVPTEIAHSPRPEDVPGTLLSLILASDAPRAAIPSGHLTLPLALAILAGRARLPHAWIYIPWTVIIGVVILTTHQHYIHDALGALCWGTVGSLLAMRLCRPGRA